MATKVRQCGNYIKIWISFLQRLQDFFNINSRWFVTSMTIMDIIAFPFLCCLSATLLVETCTVCAMQTFLLLKLITKFNIHSLSTASEKNKIQAIFVSLDLKFLSLPKPCKAKQQLIVAFSIFAILTVPFYVLIWMVSF